MNNTYNIFGLTILSEIPLPATPIEYPPSKIAPDVIVSYGETPEELPSPQTKGRRFQSAPGQFLLRIESLARYYVRNGREITVTAIPGAEEEKILIFLMGSAFGALLHQRSILVLHASAISIENAAIVFMGPSGIGKSTLAAGFHKRGCQFLADDVCAIALTNGKPAVIPGFPRLKLWPDTLNLLGRNRAELRSVSMAPHRVKYFLPVQSPHEIPVPIKTAFLLDRVRSESFILAPLAGLAKVDSLIAHTYRLGFLQGTGTREGHFRQCAAVSDQIGIYRVSRPENGPTLDDLMDFIERSFYE